MTQKSSQKLKLLYVLQMLERETDENSGLTMNEILQRLEEKGISAERKSIYRDMEVLQDFGLQIDRIQKKPVEYTLSKQGFTLPELNLLLDSVQSNRFLDERTSEELEEKIRNMASVKGRDRLNERIHVVGRIKSQNESVFHNINTIHDAMKQKRKVQFSYFKRDNELKPTQLYDGKTYEHTPVRVALVNGFYYLITWNESYEQFNQFRLDRMRLVMVSEKPATRNEQIANYEFQDSSWYVFGMFDGESTRAKLKVYPGLMDTAYDKFGDNMEVKPLKDGTAEVTVRIRMSQMFYGWIAGLNGGITILGPKKLVAGYREHLQNLLDAME